MEPAIAIYMGAPVSIGSEIRALKQLYCDLQKVGRDALLFVNFEVGGRQIDCLVVTELQATMLDFKNLNGPVKGGVNGPWMLRDYGGSERRYEGENPYEQGREAKYKLANALKEFHCASGVGVAPDKGQFFRLFDAAVCVYPDLDPQSTVRGDFKCWVWGYPKALRQITTRELTSRWSIQEWVRFATEHLNLEKVSLEAAVSPEHREAEVALNTYTQSLCEDLSAEVFPELPGSAISLPIDQHVLLIGPSGIGKTVRLGRHAISLTCENRLVLFCSGRHYVDSLDRLLAKSVAPYSKKSPAQLLEAVNKCGWSIDLIVDGIDGFTERRLQDFTDGVASLALRYGARVIMSSQAEVNIPPGIKSLAIEITPLTDEQKLAVFEFHAEANCSPPDGLLAAFKTAHDIMVAAKSASFVPLGGSRADYYAAYIFESLPLEHRTVAGALARHLADHLHQKIARSLEFSVFENESRKFLRAAGGSLDIADRVTELPLVSASRGLFAFTHDLWQDYLAAEHLLSLTDDPQALCDELSKPINRRLLPHAIGRMRDPDMLGRIIERACDSELVADGFASGLGQECKAILDGMRQRLWDDLLIDAGSIEVIPVAVENTPSGILAAWPEITSHKTWSACERNVAGWISARLHETEIALRFTEILETCSLSLWNACETAVSRGTLSARRLFSDSLHMLLYFEGPSLPLTPFGMFRLWDKSGWNRKSQSHSNLALRNLLLERLETCPTEAKDVLTFCVASILRHKPSPDPNLVNRIFHMGWKRGLLPVRTQLLELIEWRGQYLMESAPDLADSIREELEGALGDDPISNTFIFDALNALGSVPPPVSYEDALEELRGVIDPCSEYAEKVTNLHELLQSQFPDSSSEVNPLATRASGLVGKFWEEIFQGVYWDAYTALNQREKVQLMNLAAMGSSFFLSDSFVLRELVRFEDASSKAAFQFHAETVRIDEAMQQEAVAMWCLGIIGCARIGAPLPIRQNVAGTASLAWRLIGELLYSKHIGESTLQETDEIWLTLRSEAANGAVDVLFHLQHAEHIIGSDTENQEYWYRALFIKSESRMRELLEYSLLHLDQLVSMAKWDRRDERNRFIVQTLGVVGNQPSVAILRQFIGHPILGKEVVAAIEQINGRVA